MKMVSRAILWGESSFGSCRRILKRAKRLPFSRMRGGFAVFFSFFDTLSRRWAGVKSETVNLQQLLNGFVNSLGRIPDAQFRHGRRHGFPPDIIMQNACCRLKQRLPGGILLQ